MAAITNELQGVNGFWRRGTATSGDVLAAKVGFYPVIEGFSISGLGGAAAGRVDFRCKTTTTTIGFGAAFSITTAANVAVSGARIAMAVGEALEIVLTGTAPTSFSWTFWGRYLPTDTPISDNKTGAAP